MRSKRSFEGALRVRLFSVLAMAWVLSASADTTVTLLHFSDYHSHALPHYSEGKPDQGGLPRLISYLKSERLRGALVFSGGDMMNRGSPAWSDKYHCMEWPWFDHLLHAMAFGNHDSDYGPDVFARCRSAVQFPILSANTLTSDGHPLLMPYLVVESKGIRVGVFAVAGPDFSTLMTPATRPVSGARFGDPVAAARDVVAALREKEKASLVIMIGHQERSDDVALARQVPGIDLIFGTHSHLKEGLTRISGTNTRFISSYQYATYVSRVEVTMRRGKVRRLRGRLVPMDRAVSPDPRVADAVRKLQRELESDPQYAPLFQVVGRLPKPRPLRQLADDTLELMRNVTRADIALSTPSSFRQDLPAGDITLEHLRASMPYDNEIVVGELSGRQLAELMKDILAATKGNAVWTTPVDQIVEERTYRVATTDYLARVSVWRDHFTAGVRPTGLRVREEMRKRIAATLR